jgi:geranylgeranyl diphosphate synthase type II
VGGAQPAAVRALSRAGHDLGLAFQIQDDLLNRGAGLERLGKRGGTDAARGKATYPGAVGDDRAATAARTLAASARRRVEALGPRARALARLIEATASRDR